MQAVIKTPATQTLAPASSGSETHQLKSDAVLILRSGNLSTQTTLLWSIIGSIQDMVCSTSLCSHDFTYFFIYEDPSTIDDMHAARNPDIIRKWLDSQVAADFDGKSIKSMLCMSLEELSDVRFIYAHTLSANSNFSFILTMRACHAASRLPPWIFLMLSIARR